MISLCIIWTHSGVGLVLMLVFCQTLSRCWCFLLLVSRSCSSLMRVIVWVQEAAAWATSSVIRSLTPSRGSHSAVQPRRSAFGEYSPPPLHLQILKCSYYGLWKVHIWVLGSPATDCMQGQKTRSLSYNMHLFLPYLLNDSQTVHFSKPRLCVRLICSDWSISFKAECSVTLCTALLWKPLQKRHQRMNLHSDQQVGGNMLMFHDEVKQGFVFSNV